MVSILLAGDTMLGRLVNQAMLRGGPAYPWGDVLPVLATANLRIVNLECVVARTGTPWNRWLKVFHFRADPVAIEALKLAGVNAVVIANNHVLDYEEAAFLEMLGHLQAADIACVGAGRNLQAAREPIVLEADGLRVGVWAFTDNEPGWAAGADTPGTNYLKVEPASLPVVWEGIARARALGADLVIVSAHWGPNMRARPPEGFRRFARAVLEAGADAFHGHSAHVFQGLEVHEAKPILYDCGEFVDDYAVDADLRNDRNLLYRLEVEDGHVRRLELIPILIDDCQVNLARGSDFEAISERVTRLSAELGAQVRREGHHLRVACDEPAPA